MDMATQRRFPKERTERGKNDRPREGGRVGG